MSRRVRRHLKTKSSRQFCQEKFSCADRAEAVYDCEECKSLQCRDCEKALHQLPKFAFHDRKYIQPPTPDKLCQNSCDDKNFADVRCENCASNLCFECFEKLHKHSKRKHHKKIPFDQFIETATVAAESDSNSEVDIVNNDESKLSSVDLAGEEGLFFSTVTTHGIEPVLPSSPIESGEKKSSLTYISCPQEVQENYYSFDEHYCFNEQTSCNGQIKMHGQKKVPLSGENGTIVSGLPDISAIPKPQKLENKHTSSQKNEKSDKLEDDKLLNHVKNFLLADKCEILQLKDDKEFEAKLQCSADAEVKVVSIFGNTGDGKSHTLNHTFFNGQEIFQTSPSPQACTVGVWAAFDTVHNAIIIDTEGFQGVTDNPNRRTRLLLKVLAISDVIIYRTRAERLTNDLFQFIGDASKAFVKHFKMELEAASNRFKLDRPLSSLGMAVVIFHETQHTELLDKGFNPSDVIQNLRQRFADLKLSIDAFNSLHYVGTKTVKLPTNFSGLKRKLEDLLDDNSIRARRKPTYVYQTLKILNEKFIGDIDKIMPSTFPDQYFTCVSTCLSCGAQCMETMNHYQENKPHATEPRCRYQHQYDNKVYLCKTCHNEGESNIVIPKTSSANDNVWVGLAKFTWSGYVLECPKCGIIYNSRKYWYGNQDPDKSAVCTEIRHVWPGGNLVLQGHHNAGRRVLDSIQYLSEQVANLSTKPAKMVSSWVNDQIAPSYWTPNAEITHCHAGCGVEFDHFTSIHHCRACGQGFCDECSTKRRPVPERGWGSEAVRVCNSCFENGTPNPDESVIEGDATARKIGEAVSSTVVSVTSLVNYPIGIIRDSARPTYWIADENITECCVCKAEFGPKLNIHHCRACGEGVCKECSQRYRKVPSRGWDHPVRICDTCDKKPGEL